MISGCLFIVSCRAVCLWRSRATVAAEFNRWYAVAATLDVGRLLLDGLRLGILGLDMLYQHTGCCEISARRGRALSTVLYSGQLSVVVFSSWFLLYQMGGPSVVDFLSRGADVGSSATMVGVVADLTIIPDLAPSSHASCDGTDDVSPGLRCFSCLACPGPRPGFSSRRSAFTGPSV